MSTAIGNRLEGKVALVTGATGGIGEAVAHLFLDQGAKVMLVGRSATKLRDTTDRLGARGALGSVKADVGDEAAVEAAVQATVDRFGGLDMLVANAGTEGTVGPFEQQTLTDFETVLRTNVIGVWLAMKHAVAPMKARNGGSMIAVGSMAGVIGFPGITPYATSKHAVCGLVRSAALELGPTGIRVNAIAPGPIENRMMRSLETQMMPDDPGTMYGALKEMLPMKRYGSNEEVARLALFLASDDSSFTTGAVHLMDGGYTAA